MYESVQENGVERAGGSIHGVLDYGDDVGCIDDDVACERLVFDVFQNCYIEFSQSTSDNSKCLDSPSAPRFNPIPQSPSPTMVSNLVTAGSA